MRWILAIGLALISFSSASATPPARLITAVADPDFDRNAVSQIAPLSATLKKDPAFNVMASRLGEVLKKAGLNVQQDAPEADIYVLFNYATVSIPAFRQFGSINDGGYRAVVVTAIAGRPWRESRQVKVVWQTAFDQPGVSVNPERVIPPLLMQGVPWYGRALTSKGLGPIARCNSDTVGTGSHVPFACMNRNSPAAAILSVVPNSVTAQK